MNLVDRRHHVLRRLALLCAVLVLAVTSLSAFLRLSKVGLGCADWPACYGQDLRRAQQGGSASDEAQVATAIARLAHRITASGALLLVITMVLVCLGSKPLFVREGLLALALLALALFLAVLGWWSSTARVPAVAMGNLLGGFLMLALCVRLALPAAPVASFGARMALVLGASLLVAQVAMGGLTSASYAGLSCTGWGDCGLRESWQSADWSSLDPWREPVLAATGGNSSGTLANSLHRHLALVVLLALLPVAALAWRAGRRRTAVTVLLLLMVQLVAGGVLSTMALPLPLALLHNLLAAALLAAVLSLV